MNFPPSLVTFQSEFPDIDLYKNASVFLKYLGSGAFEGSKIGPIKLEIKFCIVYLSYSARIGHPTLRVEVRVALVHSKRLRLTLDVNYSIKKGGRGSRVA